MAEGKSWSKRAGAAVLDVLVDNIWRWIVGLVLAAVAVYFRRDPAWFLRPVQVPVWMILAAIALVVALIVTAARRQSQSPGQAGHQMSQPASAGTAAHQWRQPTRRESADSWRDYQQDCFFGFNWSWEYSDTRPVRLDITCPECKAPAALSSVYVTGSGNRLDLACPKCRKHITTDIKIGESPLIWLAQKVKEAVQDGQVAPK